ncbi:NAD-dependent epimerase/dehydratase family protein [Corticibacter populi]|uniref:NAD-dependent epimerase/dehydratase family protein n=1 Tax=Corticibacter populi TaxID=1550736 RepID=A0A3M6QTL4_9BURK|nr:NAD(P)H-binding protein [Corticibacter populi]RMX05899.1 NAD-dependent epimerase/dehydratase family protein [Corticibacter populi]RZS30782.1 uncharacterized protein YbjT (DUF2867 family) [Corticibacter populi]
MYPNLLSISHPPVAAAPARTIAITGATGKLGRLLLPRLLQLGHHVRAISRRPVFEQTDSLDRLSWFTADLASPQTLHRPLQGVDAVFLLSPIGETMDQLQIGLIEAAAALRVPRIVKLSGSHWTMTPPSRTLAGALHHRIESRLAGHPGEVAIIRPNAWTQALLSGLAGPLEHGDEITSPYGNAAVAFTDIEDIADMAAHLLAVQALPARQPIVMSGPSAMDFTDIAAHLSERLGRCIRYRPLTNAEYAHQLQSSQPTPFLRHVKRQFAELIARGEAAPVTDATPRLLGQPARPPQHYLNRLAALV